MLVWSSMVRSSDDAPEMSDRPTGADPQESTEPHRTGKRSALIGWLTGVVALALVAVPAFYAGIFAIAGYTGCFLSCSEPEPSVGLLWTGVTIVLLALPVAVGVVAARVRSVGGWLMVGVVVVVLFIGYQSLQGAF